MQILHRIAFVASEADRRYIERMGMKLHPTGKVPAGFIAFDASESDPNWPAVRRWIEQRGLGVHSVRTTFTNREIGEARWLNLQPDWHHGYPQPEHDFGYTRTTYDPTSACQICGVGGRQKAPFAMAGEPRWGTRGILQLNWVFDEYFAKPDIAETVFGPMGIGSRPVLNRRGDELRTVVQLVVTERVSIETDSLEPERCPICGRTKFEPIARGMVPALLVEPTGHMARSDEVFGGGALAFEQVIVSRELAQRIRAAGVKGVSFRPVASRKEAGVKGLGSD